MSKNGEYQCSQCGGVYPLTPEFFQRDKHRANGFMGACKTCATRRRREYLQTEQGKSMLRQSSHKSHLENTTRNRNLNPYADETKSKTCPDCLRELGLSEFYRNRSRPDGLKSICKDCTKTRIAAFRAKNPEKAMESNRRAVGKWKGNNPEKARQMEIDATLRRRSREVSALHDFTPEDWQYALDYFNGCCAVCGRQAHDLFGERTIATDHWIPLSKGGHTIPENMIPLCHGLDGCNNKKHDIMPQEWLERGFGKKKARVILARIEEFFATVRKGNITMDIDNQIILAEAKGA